MIGHLVKHSSFGLGRILTQTGNHLSVEFFFPNQILTIASGRTLKHALLPPETRCKTSSGQLGHISTILPAPDQSHPHRYQVRNDNGLVEEVSELDLVPIEAPRSTSPLEALADLHIEGYAKFNKRETLSDALRASVRRAIGLRALLSSRIDLRPHQAYVAGTVLMDRIPRYILADEVGLGKTIEAGIIIHDLINQNQSARILVVCPDALSQQWLCELYSKFSGRIFSMLELKKGDAVDLKTIASFSSALLNSRQLLLQKWDLVVIDEVHHLLGHEELYRLAQTLSRSTLGCLLLSALPAQRREEEYLRLLALLEPDRYRPDLPGENERFRVLYATQTDLGRKLSYLSRRLSEYASGEVDPVFLIKKILELTALPVLAQDSCLASVAATLNPESRDFVSASRSLLHRIGDRYRISRRVLRNRRSQLFDTEPDLKVSRSLHRIEYSPDQLEIDVSDSTRRFLVALRERSVSESVLFPLTRHLFQALCHPECICNILTLSTPGRGAKTEVIEFDAHLSYNNFRDYISDLWGGIGSSMPEEELDALTRSADRWRSGQGKASARVQALLQFLQAKHKQQPSRKFILFAGFPGLTSLVVDLLRREFGPESIAEFRWNLESQQKEKGVIRFKRDSLCWVMVSDETGGEGRNFQFADELVHFDLPWQVSKVEQRIGRLDRIGRLSPEVCSNVLVSYGGPDEGLLVCLHDGFQVFAQSISGLEFAISHLERKMTQVALEDVHEAMTQLARLIRDESTIERAEDDIHAALDAGSMERVTADVYMRAQSSPVCDQELEQVFCDYLQFVGGRNSVVKVRDARYADGVLEFRPNQLVDFTLNLPVETNGGVRDRVGTFRREIAQERPDLEFFTFGNEFFDAVCATLRQSAKGRVYAVECACPKVQWRGFEFAYRPNGRRELLNDHPGLVKHLDRIFAVRLEHCFIEETLKPAKDHTALLAIRHGLKREDKDVNWQNFTLNNTRICLLAGRYPDWADLVAKAESVARVEARERFNLLLSATIGDENKRIAEQIRQARVSQSDGWREEVAALEVLLEAISTWDLELDAVGFLSVNGELIP